MSTIGGLGTRAPHAQDEAMRAPSAVVRPSDRPDASREALAAVVTGLLGIAVLAALFVGLGFAIRGPLGSVRRWDATVTRWFFEQRSGTGNVLSHIGTWLAETPTVVVLGVATALVLAKRRRFHDVALVVGALLVEIATYLVTVLAVDRPRPAHQLETRFTGSFPSGHVAAAVVLYGLLAYLVARSVRSSVVRALVFCAPLLVVIAVGTARLYREMHHFSDVVAGALMGVGALIVASRLARHVTNGKEAS
jgi:membrane-associated phospholipid phosphatase